LLDYFCGQVALRALSVCQSVSLVRASIAKTTEHRNTTIGVNVYR